jgi:hypothetical protein
VGEEDLEVAAGRDRPVLREAVDLSPELVAGSSGDGVERQLRLGVSVGGELAAGGST